MACFDENVALDFVVGTLPNGTAQEIESHMARCDSCRRLVAELAKVTSRREVPEEQADPSVGLSPATRPLTGPPTRLDPGTQVGRYTILYRLGAGGMGDVHAAYDPKLDRRVALKFVRDDVQRESSSSHHRRLVREARALARLSHPNVVKIYDVAVHEDHVYLAMELVEGSDARRWLEYGSRTSREIVEVYLGALAALSAAHSQGVIHRDFKPDNVLVGGDGMARVTDFGLARGSGAPANAEPISARGALGTVTATGWAVGTPRYMAPEQFANRADEKSDQFAFCVSLYEAVFGHYPFGTKSPEELEPDKPLADQCLSPLDADKEELRSLLLKGMAIKPEDRWPSLTRLEAELRVILAPRPARFWRTAAVAAGAMAAVGAIIAVPMMRDDNDRADHRRAQEVATLKQELASLRSQLRRYELSDARRRELESRLAETEAQLSLALSERIDLDEADETPSRRPRTPVAALPPAAVERAVSIRLAEILACYNNSVIDRDDREYVRATLGVDESGKVTWTRPPYQGSRTAASCFDKVLRRLALPSWPAKTTATLDLSFYRLETGLLTAEIEVATRAAVGSSVHVDGSGRLLVDCSPNDPLCGLDLLKRSD